MGLLLGLFMVNVFMCLVEEKLVCENKFLSFYKRYVDDMLVLVCDFFDVIDLLVCFNEVYFFI